MGRNKKSKINVQSFTKKWTNRLLWFGCLWITWSYVLASLGKLDIAESLSSTVVNVVIGVAVTYMIRAFFDTFAEKKQELKEKELMIKGNVNEDKEVKG